MGSDIRPCQNCHGRGVITEEITPGKWKTRTCPACGGSGKIIISTI
jgi:DnaJ-class molecular chaperone